VGHSTPCTRNPTPGNHALWHRDQSMFDPGCVHCEAARSSTRQAHSYEIPIRLPALRDEDGDQVAATELPCAARPDDWSARAPIETRRQSARIYRCCP
jgi:hypothetical protein